jgi:hypothetical protein
MLTSHFQAPQLLLMQLAFYIETSVVDQERFSPDTDPDPDATLQVPTF